MCHVLLFALQCLLGPEADAPLRRRTVLHQFLLYFVDFIAAPAGFLLLISGYRLVKALARVRADKQRMAKEKAQQQGQTGQTQTTATGASTSATGATTVDMGTYVEMPKSPNSAENKGQPQQEQPQEKAHVDVYKGLFESVHGHFAVIASVVCVFDLCCVIRWLIVHALLCVG